MKTFVLKIGSYIGVATELFTINKNYKRDAQSSIEAQNAAGFVSLEYTALVAPAEYASTCVVMSTRTKATSSRIVQVSNLKHTFQYNILHLVHQHILSA